MKRKYRSKKIRIVGAVVFLALMIFSSVFVIWQMKTNEFGGLIDRIEEVFYSFATKYCSHHRPLDYPICDSYVEKVLCYFRDRDKFASFKTPELKDYTKFKGTLIDFRSFYGLDQYNLKEIDKYMWQLGKEYFPKNYRKKKVQEEQ